MTFSKLLPLVGAFVRDIYKVDTFTSMVCWWYTHITHNLCVLIWTSLCKYWCYSPFMSNKSTNGPCFASILTSTVCIYGKNTQLWPLIAMPVYIMLCTCTWHRPIFCHNDLILCDTFAIQCDTVHIDTFTSIVCWWYTHITHNLCALVWISWAVLVWTSLCKYWCYSPFMSNKSANGPCLTSILISTACIYGKQHSVVTLNSMPVYIM